MQTGGPAARCPRRGDGGARRGGEEWEEHSGHCPCKQRRAAASGSWASGGGGDRGGGGGGGKGTSRGVGAGVVGMNANGAGARDGAGAPSEEDPPRTEHALSPVVIAVSCSAGAPWESAALTAASGAKVAGPTDEVEVDRRAPAGAASTLLVGAGITSTPRVGMRCRRLWVPFAPLRPTLRARDLRSAAAAAASTSASAACRARAAPGLMPRDALLPERRRPVSAALSLRGRESERARDATVASRWPSAAGRECERALTAAAAWRARRRG